MSARDIVGGLAGAAVGAVKHPVETAGDAISKAKGVVSAGTSVGTAVAGSVVSRVRGGASEAKETAGKASERAQEAADDPSGAAKDTAVKAAAAAKTTTDVAAEAARTTLDKASQGASKTAEKTAKKAPAAKKSAKKSAKSPAKKAPAKKAAPREPQVVLAEPAPPLEPPVDVVGEALAAEAQEDTTGFGRTTEPRGGSRDEEHGEASLQRSEAAEIIEEIAEASDAGRVDVETPVGTTGADAGSNPDTAEADLQQPATEPLVDPSLTKEVKSEQDTLHQASDPEKG